MSGDELMALIVSCAVALWGWNEWIGGLLFLRKRPSQFTAQLTAWGSPVLAGLAMIFVLFHWSAQDVRNDVVYLGFYFVMWLGWLGLWNQFISYLGLNCRDDMLERNNPAAGVAVAGGVLGMTCIFGGANIGDGPGWWVVVFCAGLATATLLVLWWIQNAIAHVQEAITVDRDMAAGWRVAGFFIGAGVILGRAVAGDWHSTSATITDFAHKGWPVLLLWVFAILMDILNRPTPKRPAPSQLLCGVLPGLLLIATGVGVAVMQGSWK